MTRQELAIKAREAASELVDAGWDYDDARFATMTLASGGVLDEQLHGVSTPAIEALKAEWQAMEKPMHPAINHTADLPDFDRDTSVNGVE